MQSFLPVFIPYAHRDTEVRAREIFVQAQAGTLGSYL